MITTLSNYGRLSVYEPDPETLEFTRQRYAALLDKVYGGEWSDQDFQPASYDLLTAFDVLEHCENDVAKLEDWAQLIKPGGRIFLTVPAFPSLWGANDELSHHYRRYKKDTLTDSVSKAGMEVKKISYINFLNYPTVWISRNIKERLERRLKPTKNAPWDFELPPPAINKLLEISFAWEKWILPDIDLPFGTSLLCVIEKAPRSVPVAPYLDSAVPDRIK